MTSSGWQTSQSQDQRHTHHLYKDELGRDICSVCHMIVITPILSSDDPRLQPAVEYHPLPDVLVALYYDGPEYGLPRAPVAPYVRDIAAKEGGINRYNPEELWDKLAKLV
jgi:hypothetical protein